MFFKTALKIFHILLNKKYVLYISRVCGWVCTFLYSTICLLLHNIDTFVNISEDNITQKLTSIVFRGSDLTTQCDLFSDKRPLICVPSSAQILTSNLQTPPLTQQVTSTSKTRTHWLFSRMRHSWCVIILFNGSFGSHSVVSRNRKVSRAAN